LTAFATRSHFHLCQRIVHVAEYSLRILPEDLTGLSQLDAPWMSDKQLGSDLPFQLDDLLTQRRLGNAQSLRRDGEMKVLGNGEKVP
jgi:hypothetical protein